MSEKCSINLSVFLGGCFALFWIHCANAQAEAIGAYSHCGHLEQNYSHAESASLTSSHSFAHPWNSLNCPTGAALESGLFTPQTITPIGTQGNRCFRSPAREYQIRAGLSPPTSEFEELIFHQN